MWLNIPDFQNNPLSNKKYIRFIIRGACGLNGKEGCGIFNLLGEDLFHSIEQLVYGDLHEQERIHQEILQCLDVNRGTKDLSQFGYFKNLQVLDVSNRNLEYLPPEITLLTELQFLNASNNNINDIPWNMSDLQKLEHLNLSHQKRTLEFLNTKGQLQNLKVLNVSNNTLYISSNLWETYPMLEFLDMSFTSVPGQLPGKLPYDLFASMHNLKWLNLSHCKLDRVPGSLSDLQVLRYLNLSHNHMIYDTFMDIPVSLYYIDLSHNRLCNIEPIITKLSSLESLRLDNNLLKNQLPTFFTELTSLKDVTIVGNPLVKKKQRLPSPVEWMSKPLNPYGSTSLELQILSEGNGMSWDEAEELAKKWREWKNKEEEDDEDDDDEVEQTDWRAFIAENNL